MKRKKDKKKNSKRRLLLLILLLVVSLVALMTGTYAWFTLNRTVNVEQLQVDVRAVNGLEISATASKSDWSARMSIDDLGRANSSGYAINQVPSYLGNTSTNLSLITTGANAGLMNMYYGRTYANESTGEYYLTTQPLDETRCIGTACGETVYFVAYDMYLKVDENTQILMTGTSQVSPKGEDHGVKNAVRVAFVKEGHVSSDNYWNKSDINGTGYDGPAYIRSLNDARTRADDVILWEPNKNRHTDSALLNASMYYGNDSLSNNESSALRYTGAAKACDDIPLKAFGNKTLYTTGDLDECFERVIPDLATSDEDTASQPIFSLDAGVTKFRVYIWVEGNDVDAENNATGAGFNVNLEFTLPTS